MNYSISKYDNYTHAQRVGFFDNIDYVISQVDLQKRSNAKALKELLTKIFKDSDNNNYIRKKSLETICKLTVASVIRKGYTSDLLLDVEENDDIFVLCAAIKYLFYFHEEDETASINKLKKLATHSSAEVISESNFRLGQICFFSTSNDKADNGFKLSLIHI